MQLSFKDKRALQQTVVEQSKILSSNPSFSVKRLAQKAKTEALAKLGMVSVKQPSSAGQVSIDNSNFGLQASGIKTRERINAQVIAITDQIRAGKDPATLTADEIAMLKQYSGKGGLTINSQHEYYTPTHIAEGVWDTLIINGFENGNVLEPSTGAGVFLATKPHGVVATGTELDPTSATVAQVLNPTDLVSNQAFEALAANTEDNTFDAVIGNVPFGSARGANAYDDPPYKDEKLIERYFVQRTIDKVRPGGLICLIVPINIIGAKGKTWEKFRIAISKKAEFLGGHKLPSKTFSKQGTDVVIDVLVMRKHSAEFLGKVDDLPFDTLKSANVIWDEFITGKYWLGEGKRFIKGEFVPKDPTKFRDADKVIAGENMTDEALKRSLAVKFDSRIDWDALAAAEPIPFSYSEGDTKSINGQDMRLTNGAWTPVVYDIQKTPLDSAVFGVDSLEALDGLLQSDVGVLSMGWGHLEAALRSFPNQVPHNVKSALRFADMQPDEHQWRAFRGAIIGAKIESYLNGGNDNVGELDEIKELVLAEMVKYGHPKDIKGLVLAGKESKQLGMFINAIDEQGNFSALLESGEIKQDTARYDAKDPLSIIEYLFEENRVPVELSTLIEMYEGDSVLEDLGDVAKIETLAVSPDGFVYPYHQYCSGNVYPKLRAMRDAIATEKDARLIDKYKRQIEAIDGKRKKTATEDISFGMRQKWVTGNKAYVIEFLHSNGYARTIGFNEETGLFSKHGVSGGLVPQIVNYLNGDTVSGGVKAAEYKDQIRDLESQFDAFMKAHPNSEDLTAMYNEKFNGYVEFDYGASDLNLKNLGGRIKPHQYQNKAVRRLSTEGIGILGFDVGLGKSFSALALQAYNEQMGRAKRTCITVPDSVLANWYHEHIAFYKDTSRMLFVGISPKLDGDGNPVQEPILDEKGLPKTDKDGNVIYQHVLRKDDAEMIWDKMHRIPQSELSLVVMTQPQFARIPVKPATKKAYAADMTKRELLSEAEAKKMVEANPGKLSYADAVEQDRLAQKYADEGTAKKDAYPYFEDMGFDSVIVDEAHFFKNSFTPGKESQRIAYLPTPSPSQRAIDMSLKMSHIRAENGGRGVVLLTATPVTNSPLEIYNMLSLMIPMDEFEAFGVYTPDDFVRVFGQIETIEKMKVSGDVGPADAMVGFQNLDGLRSLFHKYSIIKTAEDVKLPLPDSDEIQATVELSEEQDEIYQALRAEAKKASSPNKDVRASARPLFSIIRDMDRTTTDLDMYHKQITFVFMGQHKDAVEKALSMMPKTVDRKEYDSDLERDVTVTVPFKYEVEEKDGKLIVKMTDAAEDGMVDAINKVGIPENEVAHPVTPKYAKLIENLKAELELGGKQLIFIEEKTQHHKLARIIVHFLPITLENIGIINATDANGEKLQRISDEYNSGKKIIVIANKKAEVGVNLQKGTTAIHHLTFPWVPASMQQRNGRGVRQGNTAKMVRIYHYIGKGSFDLFRLNLINQKGNWIRDILQGDESTMQSKGDGHMSAEDVMVLLSDNPEEARARMEEAKAKREAAKKEKSNKGAVITLNQLAEARRKLAILDKLKADEQTKLVDDIAKAEGRIAAFKDDGTEEAKTKLADLQRKKRSLENSLSVLDAKYSRIAENAEATIKQKTVLLKGKARTGELPFNESVIDNTDAVLISRDAKVIAVGNIYEIEQKNYSVQRVNGLYLVKSIDVHNRTFNVIAKASSYEITMKLGDLHGYTLVQVAMTKEDWDIAAMLSANFTLPGIVELGKDMVEKYRDQIVFRYNEAYLADIGDGSCDIMDNRSSNGLPADFIFPDAANSDMKAKVAKLSGNYPDWRINGVMAILFGTAWKEAIKSYLTLAAEEAVMREVAGQFNGIVNDSGGDEYAYMETHYKAYDNGDVTDLAKLLMPFVTHLGDNRNDISRWVMQFAQDRKTAFIEERRRRILEQEQQAAKSDPNYKEVPAEIAKRLSEVGITAAYNQKVLYARKSYPPFSLLLLQDKNAKSGLLFKAKDDLKSYFGATFGTDLGEGFKGALWYLPADRDIAKVAALILPDGDAKAALEQEKMKPEKLMVPVGKVSIGDTVAGFIVKDLGKSWEAKDYHISKVKADSGFDIDAGDLIQYARF